QREGGWRAVQSIGVAVPAAPVARAQRGEVGKDHRRGLVHAGRHGAEACGWLIVVMNQLRRQGCERFGHWRCYSAWAIRSCPSAATMRARANSPTLIRVDALFG